MPFDIKRHYFIYIRNDFMKKLIVLACVILAFALALAGCGGTGNQNNTQNSGMTAQSSQNTNTGSQDSQNNGQNTNSGSQTSQNNSQTSQNNSDSDNNTTPTEDDTIEHGNNGDNGRIVDHDGIIGNDETATHSENIFDAAGNMIEDGADRLATAASDVLM